MVNDALGSILRCARADFNNRFAVARHLYPDLDPGIFVEFIQTAVDELAQAVLTVRADKLAEVIAVAYDAALTLVGQKLVGSGARLSGVEKGWRCVLPRVTSLVAISPDRIISGVCNAIHRLTSTPGARVDQWIDVMQKLGPRCGDVDVFLKLGQVCAWRAGLAHYRQGAIATADTLPQSLVLEALGACSGLTWVQARQQLLRNPWYDPAAPQESASFRVVARVGSFRGFGGLFVEPPVAAPSGDHFLIRSGTECWLLVADGFGATFHRASLEEFEAAAEAARLPPEVKITASCLTWNDNRVPLPVLGEATSAAVNTTTLALTGRYTHSVALIAPGDRP